MITELKVLQMQEEIQMFIKKLNSGGCIHFAYFFSQALRLKHISHKICFMDYEPISLSYQNFDAVSHVMVFIPNIGYIDGYNLYVNKNAYLNHYNEPFTATVKLSLTKLEIFRTECSWNHAYNKRQNKQLSKIISNHVRSW